MPWPGPREKAIRPAAGPRPEDCAVLPGARGRGVAAAHEHQPPSIGSPLGSVSQKAWWNDIGCLLQTKITNIISLPGFGCLATHAGRLLYLFREEPNCCRPSRLSRTGAPFTKQAGVTGPHLLSHPE
jgi:hypothetical protein